LLRRHGDQAREGIVEFQPSTDNWAREGRSELILNLSRESQVADLRFYNLEINSPIVGFFWYT